MAGSAGWDPQDLPDLTGRTAVVTGANSGLGLQTTLGLAGAGARVLMTARDPHRGEQALATVRSELPSSLVELVRLDVADVAGIRQAAADIASRAERVDILINNAGVMAPPLGRTTDGFEQQMGTNHLGPFALTGLLWPMLAAGHAARVVTVSSVLHRYGRIDLADVNWERRRYRAWRAYGQSKLANLLFTIELNRRALEVGADVSGVAAHPGYSDTNLALAGPSFARNRLGRAVVARVSPLVGQTAAAGAWPILYAAGMPDVAAGDYLGPAGPGGLRGRPVRVGRSGAALDGAMAAQLWQLSEQLTGVHFPQPTR